MVNFTAGPRNTIKSVLLLLTVYRAKNLHSASGVRACKIGKQNMPQAYEQVRIAKFQSAVVTV